jgi:pilus assembly protein CpaE
MTLGRHMKVVAILASQESGESMDETCANMNGTKVEVHVGQVQDVAAGISIFEGIDALLLEIDPESEEQLGELSRILGEDFAGTPVMVTSAKASLQNVRNFMRMGVLDFVPQPFEQSEILAALELIADRKIAKALGKGPRAGKVITFLKGGGGSGATTLAVQSALRLAEKYNGEEAEICVLDLDIQFGTVGLYMDLEKSVGLGDLLESPERMDAELLRTVMGHHISGVDILGAPRDIMSLDSISPEFIERLLTTARKTYKFILVDLPESWTEWSHRAVEMSDMVYLVTQLSVAGVRRSKRQLDTLQQETLNKVPLQVVLNRYERSSRAIPLKEAEKALGHEFDHQIYNDYKTVIEALNQGVSVSKIKRKSKMVLSVNEMIDKADFKLRGPVRDGSSGSSKERSEPRFSFLSRRT